MTSQFAWHAIINLDTAMLSKVVAEILHRIILGVWKDEPIGSAVEVGDEAAAEAGA